MLSGIEHRETNESMMPKAFIVSNAAEAYAECRDKANALREEAGKASSPELARGLRKLARRWDILADDYAAKRL